MMGFDQVPEDVIYISTFDQNPLTQKLTADAACMGGKGWLSYAEFIANQQIYRHNIKHDCYAS